MKIPIVQVRIIRVSKDRSHILRFVLLLRVYFLDVTRAMESQIDPRVDRSALFLCGSFVLTLCIDKDALDVDEFKIDYVHSFLLLLIEECSSRIEP